MQSHRSPLLLAPRCLRSHHRGYLFRHQDYLSHLAHYRLVHFLRVWSRRSLHRASIVIQVPLYLLTRPHTRPGMLPPGMAPPLGFVPPPGFPLPPPGALLPGAAAPAPMPTPIPATPAVGPPSADPSYLPPAPHPPPMSLPPKPVAATPPVQTGPPRPFDPIAHGLKEGTVLKWTNMTHHPVRPTCLSFVPSLTQFPGL